MKSTLVALFVLGLALPAAAQGNNAPPVTSAPAAPPSDWLGAGQPVPADLVSYKNEAQGYCEAIDSRSAAASAYGDFTCSCATGVITQQAWSDYDYDHSGPFMTSADAKLIADTLRTAQTMSEASSTIYYGLSTAGQSVLSSCYSK